MREPPQETDDAASSNRIRHTQQRSYGDCQNEYEVLHRSPILGLIIK